MEHSSPATDKLDPEFAANIRLVAEGLGLAAGSYDLEIEETPEGGTVVAIIPDEQQPPSPQAA